VRSVRIVAIVLIAACVTLPQGTSAQSLTFSLFERYLESLRQQAGIPGLSAAIVQNRTVVWEHGFGLQDVESSVVATPSTPYVVGGLTETLSSVLLLKCVERGLLYLDDPIRRWTSAIPESGATVRHVLAHASSGSPGASFRHDPSRYAALSAAIDDCADMPYRKALAQAVLDPLAMIDSVPGHDVGDASNGERNLFDQGSLERYAAVIGRLATPYKVDRSSGRATRSDFPPRTLNAATGLIATVRDLARFDAALDDRDLLRGETLALAWSNMVSSGGATLPFGLGWFVQPYNADRLVWHFGLLPDSYSSLLLKVPNRNLTLILLANSDGLSAGFSLGDGDVTSSLFARLFLRLFV
jgi:CubicO group peptidase (beta-lactamase class C family)